MDFFFPVILTPQLEESGSQNYLIWLTFISDFLILSGMGNPGRGSSRESGIGSRESGIGSRESGVGNRESGVGSRK
ncbi:hypothetical protein [Spirulina subsalsa]|uniref:hypothetical protein n=1 Tax=Spirulina subsalsa TaxID=54311 RepID=UPI00036F7433|nr:hypothetical protein [Spirulina subsalsa]